MLINAFDASKSFRSLGAVQNLTQRCVCMA